LLNFKIHVWLVVFILEKITYKNLSIGLHPEIYEPSEDTFQILECLDVNKDDAVLEVGSGAGLIALECARRGCDVVCSDVNPYAVIMSEINYKNNKSVLSGSVDIRYGDLLSVLDSDECFDVVVFNPPYLPTKLDERVGGSGWFDIAVDGGFSGLFHTFRFLKDIKDFVKPGGFVYFVYSSYSDEIKLKSFLEEKKFEGRVVSSISFDDEKLDVYKICF
jgi:release factor glutamine methyltransferase